MMHSIRLFLPILLISALDAELPDQLKFEKVFPNLSFENPVGFRVDPVNGDKAYVLGQKGYVWKVNFDGAAASKEVILDISERISNREEAGLLDLVFHPDFSKNSTVILSYTNQEPAEDRISSFRMTEKGIDIDSEKIHLSVPQSIMYPNCGQIAFGPDGFLYVGVGDGGKAMDPDNNGQNLGTLFGSILRLEIVPSEAGYKIPSDNPFVERNDAKKEIWAYGLRVPWRFSFDQKTGTLYCGDVGQFAREEIDIIEKAGNYGWRVREGTKIFKGPADPSALYLPPIIDYGRDQGGCVIGGYVYRGKLEKLKGAYVFCDCVSNKFWALRYDNKKLQEFKDLGEYKYTTVSFSQDSEGELYICSFAENNIFKITGAE